MDKLRKMLPFLGVNICAFYILPFRIVYTGSAIFVLNSGDMFCYFIDLWNKKIV